MSSEGTFYSLVEKLKKLYGDFDFKKRKFEKAPNSEISRALGYSDAQFSRLINEHATEGEYHRANQNADRILALISYEEKFKKVNVNPKSALASPRKRLMFFIAGIIVGGLAIFLLLIQSQTSKNSYTRYDMLTWTFESNFINPYTGLRSIPADCNYECYKYQGKWELGNEYKLPFLRESSGFHYLAKSVEAYIRCEPNENPSGKWMNGFEYQKHEIWYDILERPISTFIHEDGSQNETYQNLIFAKESDFIMIGTIHSFYINDFRLDSTGIWRQGQDIGRDLEFESEEVLARQLKNESLLEKIRREITQIIQDPLRGFSKPSNCRVANKPIENFHDLSNGDEMTFNCQMTTAGRFPIGYSKTYVLKEQYVRDRCVEAVE